MREDGRLIVREGAIFIADSHYPHHGDLFLELLKKLHNGDIEIPQLFLMGDNFDLLFGYNDYIRTFVSEMIELLQSLSKSIEIHYFEGNHDFCLKELFPNIHVYPRKLQPVIFEMGEKRVGISHGDRYATGFGYDLYCTILRSKTMLTLLKPWEHAIIDHRMQALSQKKICRTFTEFEKRVEKIMQSYNGVDLVIEGHYHQAKIIGNYISLPSLACQGEVCMIRDGKAVFVKMESL